MDATSEPCPTSPPRSRPPARALHTGSHGEKGYPHGTAKALRLGAPFVALARCLGLQAPVLRGVSGCPRTRQLLRGFWGFHGKCASSHAPNALAAKEANTRPSGHDALRTSSTRPFIPSGTPQALLTRQRRKSLAIESIAGRLRGVYPKLRSSFTPLL